tara:strand:+ start:293 stop:889 length:597 start_codon:yes stop_codon:yes gene_type:complete
MSNKPIIASYIKDQQRVLDLGCGDGELLVYLDKLKQISAYGIELKESHVVSCIQKGLSVFQGNLDEGLKEFADNSFDVVILSQTLQQVKEPLKLMNEMCRVAKIAIVTFPNFAHWTSRLSLIRGHIPKSKILPYEWYDTPNIRVVSLKSFQRVCKHENFEILSKETFVGQSKLLKKLKFFPNMFSEKGLFVIRKNNKT